MALQNLTNIKPLCQSTIQLITDCIQHTCSQQLPNNLQFARCLHEPQTEIFIRITIILAESGSLKNKINWFSNFFYVSSSKEPHIILFHTKHSRKG